MPRIPAPLLLVCDDQALADQARQLLARSALNCTVLARACDCTRAPVCHWLKDAPLSQASRLRALLGETVEVLERTRHAFRSSELGRLRKRLEQALGELPRPNDSGKT